VFGWYWLSSAVHNELLTWHTMFFNTVKIIGKLKWKAVIVWKQLVSNFSWFRNVLHQCYTLTYRDSRSMHWGQWVYSHFIHFPLRPSATLPICHFTHASLCPQDSPWRRERLQWWGTIKNGVFIGFWAHKISVCILKVSRRKEKTAFFAFHNSTLKSN